MATKQTTGASSLNETMSQVREEGRAGIQSFLEQNPNQLAELYNSNPLSLAELLARASEDIVGEKMTSDEMKAFSVTFSRLPALSSKLLSGMGA